MKQADYVTTIPRALAAMLGGAVIGTLVFVLEIAVLLALRPSKLVELTDYVGTTNLDLILTLALFGFIFFAGGLLIAGTPVWWFLHVNGRRNWFDAVGLGAVLGSAGFVFMAMWNPEWTALSLISFLTEEFGGITAGNDGLTSEGWAALIRGTIGIAIAGALAGLAIWKIAYKRRQPRESEHAG